MPSVISSNTRDPGTCISYCLHNNYLLISLPGYPSHQSPDTTWFPCPSIRRIFTQLTGLTSDLTKGFIKIVQNLIYTKFYKRNLHKLMDLKLKDIMWCISPKIQHNYIEETYIPRNLRSRSRATASVEQACGRVFLKASPQLAPTTFPCQLRSPLPPLCLELFYCHSYSVLNSDEVSAC